MCQTKRGMVGMDCFATLAMTNGVDKGLFPKKLHAILIANILYHLSQGFFIPWELALLYLICDEVAEDTAEVFVAWV